MPIHVGFLAGYGNGEVSGTDIGTDTEAIPASAFGGFASYWFSPTLGLQAELMLSLRGGIQGRSIDVYHQPSGYFAYHVDTRTEWHLSYIELPVVIRLGRGDLVKPGGSGRNFSPFFEYGLSFGAKIDESSQDKVELMFPTWTPTPDATYDLDNPGFGTIEVSFVVGAGGELQLGKGYITSQVRFRAGMGSIGGASERAQTRDILLLAGYGWVIH